MRNEIRRLSVRIHDQRLRTSLAGARSTVNFSASNVFFGIAGWSYADWDGIVYNGRVGDKLEYVSRFVDCVEINSSFYHLPSARTAESWAARTGANERFFFTAKLPQDITHRGLLASPMVEAVQESFAPLADSGKLRHLLAQFRYDFENSRPNREYVERIQSSFSHLANVTLELRHNSWQSPQTLAWLDSLGVTVANLDYPMARDSFNLRECRVGKRRYLRLHGRNAAAWFDRNAGRDETYNYLYSREELKQIADRADSLAKDAETLTIVANNHFQGKEFANALELKSMMTRESVAVPAGLLARYPDLREIARPD